MSTLLLAALKVAFLLLMWLFILFVVNTIRADLFGRRVTEAELVAAGEAPSNMANLFRRDSGGGRTSSVTPTRITITTGRAAGNSATLPEVGDEILMGRAAACQLDVDDDYASSRHAKIWRDDEGFVVEDLRSTNGTYVNNERVTSATPFTTADTLRIGRTLMVVES